MTPQERKEIEELLPFYVNGSLSPEENALVSAACDADPELENERLFLEKLRHGVKQQGRDSGSSDLALQRLLNELPPQTENDVQKPATSKPKAANDNWWKSLAAAACLALAIQTGYMVYQGGDPELQQAGTETTDNRVVLQAMFQPTASEADIRAFLLKHNLRIIDGPSSLGIYRLQPAETKKDLTAWLKEVEQNTSILRQIGVQ